MLIECLIKREGPTRVGLGGFNYDFKKNEQGRYVAIVNSRMHREYFLSLPDFRLYDATQEDVAPAENLVELPSDTEEEAKELPDAKRKRAYSKRKKAD